MNIYKSWLLPKVVHCICGLKPMMRQRGKVVPEASGMVLEIGVGSGLNIPFYSDKVSHLVGIDPCPNYKALESALSKTNISHEMIYESAERLPFENSSVDTILTTYTFCTIPNLVSTINESRRVLKKNGKLLFIEHGIAPDAGVRKTQNRINPLWKIISGGCNLNRDIPAALSDNGFKIENMESMYLPGWKPSTWNVWGSATIA